MFPLPILIIYQAGWVKREKLLCYISSGCQTGMLLGACHAGLADLIKADGLELVGWVANRVNPGTENYAEIIKMLELNYQVKSWVRSLICQVKRARKRESVSR